jgi:hypothetical protein
MGRNTLEYLEWEECNASTIVANQFAAASVGECKQSKVEVGRQEPEGADG